MKKPFIINAFENYQYQNPFDIIDFVEFNYYKSYEETFAENNKICVVNVDDFAVMFNIAKPIYDFLERDINNKVIFSRFGESSVLPLEVIKKYNFEKFIATKQIFMLISAEFDEEKIPYCNLNLYERFVAFQKENVEIAIRNFDAVQDINNKKFTFLCLNRKDRPHRVDFYNFIKTHNLLQNSLFTMIEPQFLPTCNLPDGYDDYGNNENFSVQYGGTKVMRQNWPFAHLNPILYKDTYFSVILETHCYESEYTYITEKVFKSILIGHPFMVLSNHNYYKNLKELGYKTFDGLIDESFDEIADNNQRFLKFAESLKNLVESDLNEFLKKAKPICEHNRKTLLSNFANSYISNHKKLVDFIEKIENGGGVAAPPP